MVIVSYDPAVNVPYILFIHAYQLYSLNNQSNIKALFVYLVYHSL